MMHRKKTTKRKRLQADTRIGSTVNLVQLVEMINHELGKKTTANQLRLVVKQSRAGHRKVTKKRAKKARRRAY